MLGECAPLDVILKVADSSSADAGSRAKKIASEAYDHWIATQPHFGTLRLLAGKPALPALEALDETLKTVAVTLVAIAVAGRYAGESPLRSQVENAERAMRIATEAARRDIGA
jgi:hypothetical protein